MTDNPVADRAVSLWKTLYNWLELVKLKLVDPDTTTFEIYVSRTVTGDLVELLRKAASDTEATLALSIARDLLWGAAPNRPLKPALSAALQKYANPVLEADVSAHRNAAIFQHVAASSFERLTHLCVESPA